MPNQNSVIIAGHLGKQPEVRFTTSGIKAASFSVAWNEPPRKGEEKGAVHWIDVKAWRHCADVAESLQKGDGVHITGTVRTDKWTDKTTGKERSKMYVLADSVAPWPSKREAAAAAPANAGETSTESPEEGRKFDDVPF